jgi:formylglycine-generating enzyme required for sulfatase activity
LGGTNPRGPASDDEYLDGRVLRGDSWFSNAKNARCAYRLSDYQFFANINFGFRCVRGF